MQAAGAIQLTDENFEEEVLKFPGVVLVDFWAVWCGPCIQMTPVIANLAQKYAGNPMVKIAQLNVDEAQETAQAYHTLSIPTFMTWVNGEQADARMGAMPSPVLEEVLATCLKKLPAPAAG